MAKHIFLRSHVPALRPGILRCWTFFDGEQIFARSAAEFVERMWHDAWTGFEQATVQEYMEAVNYRAMLFGESIRCNSFENFVEDLIDVGHLVDISPVPVKRFRRMSMALPLRVLN